MSLNLRIKSSEMLIRWLDCQIDGLGMPADFRHRMAAGCLELAMEYQKAIVLLVAKQLHGAAYSLLRLTAESYVRGVWLHRCATDEDLDNFAKDTVPKFYKLLEAIEQLEAYQDRTFSDMKTRSWAAMNSYTHTGFLQIVRRQTETSIEPNYDEDEILEAVEFANAIGCLAAIAICELSSNLERAKAILNRVKEEWPLESQSGTS